MKWQDNRWAVGTVTDLAHFLSEKISADVFAYDDQRTYRTYMGYATFPNCDFIIADEDTADKVDIDAAVADGGWYGIKSVDDGFDSDYLMLVSDYYGGGAASMCTLGCCEIDDGAVDDVAGVIAHMIAETLSFSNAGVAENTMLVVELVGGMA